MQLTETFRKRFAAWLDEPTLDEAAKKLFFTSGLVVFDTNALLTLYKVGTTARDEVIDVLEKVKDRFWIPHQVGLEFARNRDNAVKGRYAEITAAKTLATRAEKKAMACIEDAIETLIDVRTRSLSQRQWDRNEAGLDLDSLKQRFEGVLTPVISELDALKSEQDSSIKRIHDHDPVLDKLDPILTGRVGRAYSSSELWKITREAVEFRYPNEIPPGYKDKDKPTMLERVGDFILWRQLLDKVGTDKTTSKVILVTNDIKPDWWHIDDNGSPAFPRRELVQEMREFGNSSLAILTLAEFMGQAGHHLQIRISTETVDQIRDAEPYVEISEPDIHHSHKTPMHFYSELERSIFDLLLDTGFEPVKDPPYNNIDSGLDFVMSRINPNGKQETYGIEILGSSRRVNATEVLRIADKMQRLGLNRGIMFSLSPVSATARSAARDRNIELIDNKSLHGMIAAVRLKLSGDDPEPTE